MRRELDETERELKSRDSVRNHKHRLLVSLSYGAGLRVSEAVASKVRKL